MSVAYSSIVYPEPADYNISPKVARKPLNEETGERVSAADFTKLEKQKLHIPSLLCIMSIGFIANCEYGVVMPSIWGYLKSVGGTESQLGYALSACSLLQLGFLPIIGFWSDKRTMKEVITISMVIGILGNVLYASAGVLESPWCIIAGRALVGIYMGVIAVTNSFVALVTTPETRTKFMAQINGINAIGMVSGPGFNAFLALTNFKMGPFIVDSGTSPGWFIASLVTLSCLGFLLVFREPKPPPPKRQELQGTATSYNKILTSQQHKQLLQAQQNSQQMTVKKYMKFILTSFFKPYGACFVICFVQNFDFSVLETIATVLTANMYGFKSFENSLFYSALSLEMVVIIFITAAASRFNVQDRIILLAAQTSVGVGAIGMFFYYPQAHLPFWKFSLFAAFLVAGIPSQNISVMSTYSKLLTAEYGQTKQGLYTGIIMLFGSLARILGPLWGGSTLEHNQIVLLFGLLVVMWLFDVIFTLSFFKKLKPMTLNESDERVSLLASENR